MNERLKAALNNYGMKIAIVAPKAELDMARACVADELAKATAAGDSPAEAVKELLGYDAMALSGYNGDKKSPDATSGAETGNPKDAGWGKDTEQTEPAYVHPVESVEADPKATDLRSKESGTMKNDHSEFLKSIGLDTNADDLSAMVSKFKADQAAAVAAATESARVSAINDAIATTQASLLSGLDQEAQNLIVSQIKRYAATADDVERIAKDELTNVAPFIAKARLAAQGFNGSFSAAQGQTVSNPASPAHVTRESAPWMEGVDKILAATDDVLRTSSGFDPSSGEVQSLRKHNRERFIDRLIEDTVIRHKEAKTPGEWFAKADALLSGGEKALCDQIDREFNLMGDAGPITTGTLFNQPTITTALLIQQFQDMEALQFAHGIGPSLNGGPGSNGGWNLLGNGSNGSDGRIGSVLRIPVETYTTPGGYGIYAGSQYDAGLKSPEGAGIDEGAINIRWMDFAPAWRRIAVSLTRDVIRAMGNGPLNYPAVARALYHIAFDKSRRVDKGIMDEMNLISDEYAAVVVAAETVSNANNSVGITGGNNPVVVNLNTFKIANATVATGDPAVTYGANVLGAVRVKSSGVGTASPYAGALITASLGATAPIVQPRTINDINVGGAVTASTTNAISCTVAAGAQVQGYLDSTSQVQTLPGGGAAATFAVDYNNGVIVFTTGSGFTSAAGVCNVAVIVNYSYVTNYDNFVVNNPTLATGEVPSVYYNRLFQQIDQTAARMGSSPRFVKPNLAVMSMSASTWITSASIFYQFNNPKGTSLFPTDNYFFERTGVKGARVNTPWYPGDTSILMTRLGTTKYAIDTPFEIRGPYPTYEQSTGKIVAKEVYYGEENSLVCTPQVTDVNGNVINPVARRIILR